MATTKLAEVTRPHPKRARWVDDERKSRASFIASRRLLAPFLVPHRFEGNTPPAELRRAGYGYGIGLNTSYLSEILGHIRSTEVTYQWGQLDSGQSTETDGQDNEQDGTPKAGIARALYSDATKRGQTLRGFMEGDAGVLEWMLSSPGGFIVVDAPPADPNVVSKADELANGKRPYFRFVPFSSVEDLRPHPTGIGFTWVKFYEEVDTRTPSEENDGLTVHRLLYELDPNTGETTVGRFNKDGDLVDRDGNKTGAIVNLGKIVSVEGEPMLPLIPVMYGEHPEITFVGKGLLYGLDDIVIDLFNVVSETREGFRDATFGLMVHNGPDGDQVQEQLKAGTRMVTLGDAEKADLRRVAAESSEVDAGLKLIELGVKNWALSAKRQAAEAMQKSGAKNTSGVSLQAEFALDLKPLLVSVCGKLDSIQTNALYVAAQMAGLTNVQADELGIDRQTDFNLEDEATRIARIAKDYVMALPLSAEMKVQLAMAWIRAANVIDLNQEVEVPEIPDEEQKAEDAKVLAAAQASLAAGAQPNADGTPAPAPDPAVVGSIVPKARKMVKMTIGERIEQELRDLTDSEQASKSAMNAGPFTDITAGLPAAAVGRSRMKMPTSDPNNP